MAQLGIRKFDDLIGRADLLDTKKGIAHWKAKGLDFSRIFHQPDVPADVPRRQRRGRRTTAWQRALDVQADRDAASRPSSAARRCSSWRRRATSTARVGAMLSGELIRQRPEGLPDHTIFIQMEGTGGQSFGAFLAKRHHAVPDRRRQRLHRQGPVGRPHRGAPEHRLPRRGDAATSSSATPRCTARPAARPSSAAWPASASRCACRAPRRWSKAPATTAANT